MRGSVALIRKDSRIDWPEGGGANNSCWRAVAGIATDRIRQGLSVLIEHGLISVDREKSADDKRNHPNRYKILGL